MRFVNRILLGLLLSIWITCIPGGMKVLAGNLDDTGPTGPPNPTGSAECFKCLDYYGVTEGDLNFSIYLSTEPDTEFSPSSIISGATGGTNAGYSAIGTPDLNCLSLTHSSVSFNKMLSKLTCNKFPEDVIQQIDLYLHVYNDEETKVIGKILNFNTASWEYIINSVIPSTSGSSIIVKGSIYVDDPTHYIDNSVIYTYVYNVDADKDPSGSPPVPDAVMCVDYYKLCVNVDCLEANAGDPQTICEDETTQLGGDPVASGGLGGPYTYSWSPDTWLDSASSSHPVVTPSGTCTPSSSVMYTLVVTDSGCGSATASDQVKVKVCCKPEADAGPDKEVCEGESVELGPENHVVNGNYSYSWTPKTFLDDPKKKNPTASPPLDTPSQSITYTMVMTDLDCNSCTDSDQMVLSIHENPDCTVMLDSSAQDGYIEPGSVHKAWVEEPSATPATYEWKVVEVGPDTNLITDENGNPGGPDNERKVYFKAPLHPAIVKISVKVTDDNGCMCEFDPPVLVGNIPDPNGILKVSRYIPSLAGWGLLGLAALLGGAGAWAVRRRKRS